METIPPKGIAIIAVKYRRGNTTAFIAKEMSQSTK